MNIDNFLEKANVKFNNNFDYSMSVFKDRHTEITVTCKKHNLTFETKPSSHLEKKYGGCKECLKQHRKNCALKYSSNTQSFVEKANKVHNNIYSYNNFKYTLARVKSFVTCKIHGDFLCSPNNHLKSKGCPICKRKISGLNKSNTSKLAFTEKANKKHNNRYSYENFKYTKAKIKSSITCKVHGDFLCSPDNHLRGKGCPICSKSKGRFINTTSFETSCNKNLNGEGILYFLKVTDKRTQFQFYKIGITSKSVKERYPKYQYKDYNYEIIHSVKKDARKIFKEEQKIHSKYFKYKATVNTDFSGYSECYTMNLPIEDIIKTVQST